MIDMLSDGMIFWNRLRAGLGRRVSKPNSLRNILLRDGLKDWLDIGSTSFEDGFTCLSVVHNSEIDQSFQNRYICADVANLTQENLQRLGQYDLIRMQHVLEHFSPEDGFDVLQTCAQLLRHDAYLLITVPNLRYHIQAYWARYRQWSWYLSFARSRIPEDAPPSFAFSVFAHQYGYSRIRHYGEAHKWCYDHPGVIYQLKRTGQFKSIRPLDILHPLAEYPFTHNRPREDACVIAQKA